MRLQFIFMLTRQDRTVADAPAHVRTALAAGVRHIGFKDKGLAPDELRRLNLEIKRGGATSYLEVVSLDESHEIDSARIAVDIGVDCLLGGTRIEQVLPVLAGTSIRYFPFPGRIVGHPSVLAGTMDDIVDSARSLAAHPGVAGLDLLAYRSRLEPAELIRQVCAITDKPVIVAGSVDSLAQLQVCADAGAAWFTVGTAALDDAYDPDSPGLAGQLAAISRDAAVER